MNGPDEREKGVGSAAGAVIDDACRDGALEAAQHLCLRAAHGAHAHQEPEWAPCPALRQGASVEMGTYTLKEKSPLRPDSQGFAPAT